MANIDDSTLYEIITGRVEPHIYSFETNTLPNMLKVGDTYRPVEERLNEWRRYYKDLTEVSRHKAVVGDDVFFRDHSVHKYFESNDIQRAQIDESKGIYSQEFFHDIGEPDVTIAVQDVVDNYGAPGKYAYYNHLKDRIEQRYARDRDFNPRGNQQAVIENFTNAVGNGRTNLLMYAVMRFGKSITSMWCAKEIDAKLTIVVSAKADVKSEWKQTVESHKDFTGYRFMDGAEITSDMNLADVYGKPFQTGSGEHEMCTNIVIFFTLQDLAGSTDEIKARHRILEDIQPDLLIIDETHFAARAQVLGKILAGVELNEEDEESLKDTSGIDDLGRVRGLKAINAKIKLHLSGTPYRILMGSEFEQNDIIAFVQFSDIYESKINWRETHLDQEEWQNPYYGFPQMVRFAFNPNESSRKRLESIPGSKPSEIFAPVDTSKNGNYEAFKHEAEVIDLLQVLDGSKNDTQLLGLLDHESIKTGDLAQHIVIVLPHKASCDAFEKLVNERGELFKNISGYELLNIAGHNTPFRDVTSVKNAIDKADTEGKKTITLTVNKMLTGVTVPQWDTMIYLKGTISPQEYDQAIFRLQSPWVKTYTSETGDTIRYDMKPQTLLVDLDPTRLFYLQEVKAFTYGANTHSIGNENIEKFIRRELKVSPVLALNAENNKLVEINASNIMDAVRKYSSERSITDDVNDISVDISLRENEEIFNVITKLSELGSKNGLSIDPTDGDEGQELDGDTPGTEVDDADNPSSSSSSSSSDNQDDGIKAFEKQFRMYYVLILLFAFLSETNEKSLADVIQNLDANDDNKRIAKSLGLRKDDLTMLRANINWSVLSSLDYKIQNSDFRANDGSVTGVEHIEIAINKFGKISDSEVFTPSSIVDKMYDVFDDNFWNNVKSSKVLDIASKSGNFARGFVKEAQQRGVNIDDIKDNFHSIPTSPAAYEFTLKMYQALGLSVDNIAQHFTSYDILELKRPHLVAQLLENKTLGAITRADLKAIDDKIESNESEGSQVKFSAIVGNPPYQEDNASNGRDKPIYNLFMDSSYSLSDKVALITPARFLFNGGQTPKSWNAKMLSDTHIKPVYFEQDSSKVFPNTDIKGGVAITYRDTDKEFGPIGTYTRIEELNQIIHKVSGSSDYKSLNIIHHGRSSYKFTSDLYEDRPELRGRVKKNEERSVGSNIFEKLPEIFYANKQNDQQVNIKGRLENTRVIRWIDSKYLTEHPNLHKYKVLVPKSNGSGAFGETLSSPVVEGPLTGHTQTFISFGSFDDREEAEALLKYIKSKFARTMLGTVKVTQDNATKEVWRNVPLQDFMPGSDIDWSQSVANIDKQLYIKYNLDENEINFIETRVKAME